MTERAGSHGVYEMVHTPTTLFIGQNNFFTVHGNGRKALFGF
jgi:hypothetical protein